MKNLRATSHASAFLVTLFISLAGAGILKNSWQAWKRPLGQPSLSPSETDAWMRLPKSRAFEKLGAGYLHHLHGQWEEAERLYQQVIEESWDFEEVAVTRMLMERLAYERGEPRVSPAAQAPEFPAPVGPAALPAPSRKLNPAAPAPPPSAPLPVPFLHRSPQVAQAPGPQRFAPFGNETAVIGKIETLLPLFAQTAAQQLAVLMEAVGERQLSRQYSEREFQRMVLQKIQSQMSAGSLDVGVEIRPEGFAVSGTLAIGRFQPQIDSLIGITLKREHPQVLIRTLTVEGVTIPASLLRMLEERINHLLDRQRYPVRFTAFECKEGAAWISVELS